MTGTKDQVEDTRIDLSIIIENNQRRRSWGFWGSIIAMFALAFSFIRWPRLYEEVSFWQCIWLLLGAGLAGLLLALLLVRRGSSEADGIYQAYIKDLLRDGKMTNPLKKIAEEGDPAHRKLAQQMLNKAKAAWHNVGHRPG